MAFEMPLVARWLDYTLQRPCRTFVMGIISRRFVVTGMASIPFASTISFAFASRGATVMRTMSK
jgi:hypothetical protein